MARLFAHRGFCAELHPQNSVASFKEAVAQGFGAIEFDLWFLSQKLVLKHDEPHQDEIPNLAVLSDFLTHKNELFYWLDFKNFDEKNCVRALMRAKAEIENAQVKIEQIYFAPYVTNRELAAKFFAQIRSVFGVKAQIIAVCDQFNDCETVVDLKKFLDQNNVKSLSIYHQLLDQESLSVLRGIEIFAWTVNDVKRLLELEALGVQNFATDKITPQIYETTLLGSPQTR